MTGTTLDELLRQGRQQAGGDLKSLIDHPDCQMDAEAFRTFVAEVGIWAMATAGESGSPHIAPVHLRLTDDDEFQMTMHTESVRMRDIERDPRVAFTGWADGRRMAIIYGRASRIPGTDRLSGAGGRDKPVVTLKIEPTRIYAMNPTGR